MDRLCQSISSVNTPFSPATVSRRQALLDLTAKASSKTEAEPITQPRNIKQDISESFDAVSFILARAKCPTEHRAYIDAVIGASGGSLDWFEADDFTIGKRLRGAEPERQEDTPERISQRVTKTTQRERSRFDQWQAKSGFVLIESKPGGKRNGINYKTRYRVPLLAAAAEAIRWAGQSALWAKAPKKAIERATKPALQMLEGTAIKQDEFIRPRQDDQSVLNRQRKTIITNARKSIEIIQRNGGDPTDYIEKVKRELDYLIYEQEGLDQGKHDGLDRFVHSEAVRSDSIKECGQDRQSLSPPPETTQGGIAAPNADEVRRGDYEIGEPESQAVAMVVAFESAGARSFDVTITDEQKQCQEFISGMDAEHLKAILPDLLTRTEQRHLNLIVRPRSIGAQLLQLDDLNQRDVERLAGYAFLTLETSPASYQAWLAIDSQDTTMKQRLRKQIEFDAGANGAVRVAGSLNVKPHHRRADGTYPRVRLVEVEPGLLSVPAELERAGLLAPPETPPCVSHLSPLGELKIPASLPDYDMSIAPASQTGQPDRSRYDISWTMKALRRGCDPHDVLNGLRVNSPKAAARSKYAEKTVARAMDYLRDR
jgi:hypothetical protein